jgi:hypothetical protein
MSVTLKPFTSEIPLFQDTINFFSLFNSLNKKTERQVTLYPHNDDGYILSFDEGVFNERIKYAYEEKHRDKTEEEVNAYVENAKREFETWYETEGKNLYKPIQSTTNTIISDFKALQTELANCGLKVTETEAKKYFNAFKQPHQKPAEISGIGAKKYNEMQAMEYNIICQNISQLTAICNKKEQLLALKKEFFGTDQPNYERLDNFINQINHINEKDSDFEDKILQCLVTINKVDLSYVYALLSLNVVSLNEIRRKRAEIQNSDMPYREAVSALADLDAQEKLFLFELNKLHTSISDEENDTSVEPIIWDKIGDGFENGVEKVADLICAPFNWMTEKLMDLTLR